MNRFGGMRTWRWAAPWLLAGALGCAAAPRGQGPPRAPSWPYAGVAFADRLPVELQGRPLFTGRWIQSTPDGTAAYTELTGGRYLCRIPFQNRRRLQVLDLGPGAEPEALGFLDRQRSLVVLAALVSPHHTHPVVARALLEVDLEGRVLLDAVPVDRDGVAHGFALDPFGRRVFLLEDAGGGEARVRLVDLYQGGQVAEAAVGTVPARVERKGLALDKNARTVFCLVGGESTRSDFQPVSPAARGGPEMVVLSADSLSVVGRVPLDSSAEPVALAYDADRDRIYVLEATGKGSRVLSVDGAFLTVRARVDLPEETTDLVLSGGYAFAPGPHGIYIVEMDSETWVSRPTVPFDLTREMAVSGDQTLAFVLFEAASEAGEPGLAVVGLHSGNVIEVLQ